MVGLRTVQLLLLLLLGLLVPVGEGSPAVSSPGAYGCAGLGEVGTVSLLEQSPELSRAERLEAAFEEPSEVEEERPSDSGVANAVAAETPLPALWIRTRAAAPLSSSPSTPGVARGPPALG
jgi:hypothetical protein